MENIEWDTQAICENMISSSSCWPESPLPYVTYHNYLDFTNWPNDSILIKEEKAILCILQSVEKLPEESRGKVFKIAQERLDCFSKKMKGKK